MDEIKNKTYDKKENSSSYVKDQEFIIFNSKGSDIIPEDKLKEYQKVSNINIFSLSSLKNMSHEYYFCKLSCGLLSLLYNVEYYLSISKLLGYLLTPVSKCKKKVIQIKYNLNDHNITISNVYFRFSSPLRKNKNVNKKLLYWVNERNIKDIWKMYEQEFQEKPKVGDSIEVHYNVPYERKNPHYNIKHIPYIVSYVYPSNFIFPPYELESIRTYNTKQQYKNGILFATCNDTNVTDNVIQIAGPFGNFYSDLPSRYGIQIPRNLIVKDDEKEDLIITDNNANDFRFERNSLIRI